jgi:hypothetical protein
MDGRLEQHGQAPPGLPLASAFVVIANNQPELTSHVRTQRRPGRPAECGKVDGQPLTRPRIETVCNSPTDLGCKRRLHNLPELQGKARAANGRLLSIQRDVGDPRAMDLVGALCLAINAVAGFTNRSLRAQVAGLLGNPYSSSLMTYDLDIKCRHRSGEPWQCDFADAGDLEFVSNRCNDPLRHQDLPGVGMVAKS